MFNSKLTKLAAAVALSVGVATSVMAQETSSGIRGTVVSESGQVSAGAKIVVTDERTGSQKSLTANQNGSFSLTGLRVGGPYTVEVTGAAGSRTLENVYLTLGETLSLNLGLESTAVETIVVTGSVVDSAYGATGPVANFSLDDLQSAPAINRDIKDVIRIDPRIHIDEAFNDAIQCGGANPRFNSFTVDGIRFNDNFGLNSNGYPTIRIPFSFDSIDQVSAELAPFDVQYGGFTACNINAVTKSGSNEFHGSAFFDYTNDSLRGDKLEGDDVNTGAFNERRYGFNVGGPLIKDKLFFFTSYEKLEGATLFDRGAADSDAAVQVQGVSQAQLDEIADIARNLYGYEPGEFVSSIPVEDEKILAKLDWQINDSHRAALVYNYNDGDIIRESDGDSNEFEFSNHFYTQAGEFESIVGSIYSNWTDNFSTELRIGRAEFDADVTPLGGTDFGEFQITTENNGARATVYLGADDSRQANDLSYSIDSLKLTATYLTGDHVITGGFEIESLDVFNLFVQEAEGEYRFSSIEDFRNGTPNRITYESALGTNNAADAAAEFSYDINTLYIQDEYFFLDYDLTVTFGLRYDWYTSDDVPVENPIVQELYGFSNQQNLDGLDLLQPRLGVNWLATDKLEIRGGIGLYSGGNPNVWVSNNYSNNGITQIESQDRSGRSVFDIPFTGEGRPGFDIPQELFDNVANGNGFNGGLNFQDPDFEIPSEWKYALGATYTFDSGYVVYADYLYTDRQDAAFISDFSRVQVGTAPDGRPIYDSVNGRSQDFVLTNVDGDSGDSTIVSLAVAKSFDFGLDVNLSYAYTDSREVSPMTSSVAFSNYTGFAAADPENPEVRTSNFEIPHRFTLQLDYSHEFFDGLETRFTLFGTANQGRPYSFVFDGDPGFGSSAGFIDRNLLYIPTGVDDPNVVFADGFDTAAFFDFIRSEGLDQYSGSILPRNSLNSSWWHKFDLRISQDLPAFKEGHKASAFLLVENLGNLLNDDWGVLYEASFPRQQPVVGASINENNQYVFEDFITPALQTRVADASLWEIRVGVRYSF